MLELASEHYSKSDIKSLEQAIEIASEAHRGQKRASGEPYLSHCLAVAGILIEWKMDIHSVVAGVLHDAVEDGNADINEIEAKFGHDVAFLVDGVTKVGSARSGMGDISSYLPQTKANLSKLLIAVSHDLRVLLIKMADRLHNLQTLNFLPVERQQKIARESLEVFAPLADRLGMGKLRVQFEELAFSYLEPKEYVQLQKIIKKKLGRSHKKLEQVKIDVSKKLQEAGIKADLDGRIKSTYSLYKKLKKVGGDIDQVYDLMALRVLVEDKEKCYLVLGVLHSMYQPVLTKIKDYIAVPKPNGYQSLHTTVITPNEQIVEFQIRSQAMSEHADRGLSAGFHYNEQKLSKNYTRGATVQLPRNLEWISRLQELTQKIIEGGEVADGDFSVDLFDDRIFVYSPKGDIFDLPEGSYPLDFAFYVHSDVALHAHSIRVNGKIAPFNRPLQNGDIIEIETRRSVKPSSDWLEVLHTPRARHKLKAALKKD